MTSLDFNEDLFRRVRDELDQVQSPYSKMELVIKGASKFLGNCKAWNIVKELNKLKQQDTQELEAANMTLRKEVEELKMALAVKEDEIRDLKGQKMEALTQIR